MKNIKRNRRKTFNKKKKRLIGIINKMGCNHHSCYVEWEYVDGIYTPIGNYVKYMKKSTWRSYLKKYANRIVRRSKGSIPNGCSYKKLFDYS